MLERTKAMSSLIYLADDDPGLLEVFSAFLKNAGFDVKSFPTGDELAADTHSS